MTPVEIMARAAFAAEQNPKSIWEEFAQVIHDGYLRKAEVHVSALEAAGWRIVSAETVTEEMEDAGYEAAVSGLHEAMKDRVKRRSALGLPDDGAGFPSDWLSPMLKAALAAAPLYGKG